MNVLIIGGAGTFLKLLIDRLDKEGHRIFILTKEAKSENHYRKVFETYRFSYDNACLKEVFDSIRPDVTLFMGAFDRSILWNETENSPAYYISGLMNILMAFSATGKGRFVYLSSEEVCGGGFDEELSGERTRRAETKRGQALAMGEKMCQDYGGMMRADIVALRLCHLYEIPENGREADNLCARMCIEALEMGEIVIHPKDRASILYAADAVEFIYRVMVAEEHRQNLYQISSGEALPLEKVAKLLNQGLKEKAQIIQDNSRQRRGCVLSNRVFDEEFGVSIYHKPEKELVKLAEHIRADSAQFVRVERKPQDFGERWKQRAGRLVSGMIPFLENLICFIPFFMLNNRAVGSQYFQNIDFYLLYVLLFAIIYGQQQATFSALLAVAGYCFRQMYNRSGFDVMLDYNTYVWIAQLLILGLVVGYMRDQIRTGREERMHEVKYLSGQIADISDINVSNVRIKEILSNQIINQNDSFGKLYEITASLDKYEPEEVLFYAAEVLAKLMGSRDIAIYTVANQSYARLFSATSQTARNLGNSINYTQMDELYERLAKKKVYINKTMDERYPLMANAIYSEDEMQLILMVWGIPWDRMTLGQANMLTVIGYLIQNAVVRANRYMVALEHERYISGTKILEQEAFRSLVKAYLNARDRSLTECTLVSVECAGMEQEVISGRLNAMIRQSDYIGMLEDGGYYALLANTSTKDAGMVCRRFCEAGFTCRIQEEIAV